MYVRLISPWRLSRGVDTRLFGPAGWCAYDDDQGEALARAIRVELGWFNDHLPVPPRSRRCVKSRHRLRDEGICWFAGNAREMIAHAFTLAALLGECGVPIRKVATARPGTILYRDDWQIVAK